MDNASISGTNALPTDFTDFELELAARLQAVDVENSPFGEYVMDCPVCKSAVRYYFINFNEKFKMCENKQCEYPFGYEELELVKHDELFGSDEELDCATLLTSHTPQGSVISTAAWSDIDKLKAFDHDDQSDILICPNDAAREAKLKELTRLKEAELQTKKNLLDIKKLNVQLQQTYEDDDALCIKNEKWIKHLNTLQSLSGVQLLKKEEMALIKNEEMQWLSAICVLTAAVHGGGGVTKTAGLSPFWTDDYKVFEQIYGKTSDRELFGSTLPPNQSFGADISALRNQASDKKERFIDTGDSEVLEQQPSLYSFGNNFDNLLTKQNLEAFEAKPTKPTFKFIPYNDFTPISQANDPATYNYYKTLELLDKKKKIDALKSLTVNNFAQFSSYGTTNPEDTEGYKSIQDILDAHEGNKGNSKKQNTEHENLAKYVNYGVSKSRRKKPTPNARFIHNNDLPKPRCVSGRCRKRNAPPRVRSGPILRKIKHTIITD